MEREVDRPARFNLAGALEQAWVQYRANLWRVFPFAVLTVLPPLGFLHSIATGVVLVLLFEGWAIMMLTEATRLSGREENPALVPHMFHRAGGHIKNGTVIVLFVLLLLVVGFVPLVIPSIFFYSLFIFSFCHAAVRNKFAIDACMESFRSGRGNRLPLFLVAAFLYLAMAAFYTAAYLLFDGAGWAAAVPAAFFLPYYAMVIEELFEQWEAL